MRIRFAKSGLQPFGKKPAEMSEAEFQRLLRQRRANQLRLAFAEKLNRQRMRQFSALVK